MVNSHALRFVPGWKRCWFCQARRIVSCTRSSARAELLVSESAKARSEGRAERSPSRNSGSTLRPWAASAASSRSISARTVSGVAVSIAA